MKHSQKRECLHHLRDTFGLSDYRPGQKAAVHALLSGRDVMCILPTGAGKSLCWQLPSVVHQGLTVVVSPLIALMRDQVQHLQALSIPAASLDSLLAPEEREAVVRRVRRGSVRILFVSPERLAQKSFRRLCAEIPPWLVVVDEAHCIVQWGDEFRPAYSQIGEFLRSLPQRPVLCAMTATADIVMQRSIRLSLGMHRMKHILLPVVRENLVYDVRTTLDGTADIIRLCLAERCKTLIFCRTRMRAERLSAILTEHGIHAAFYHAGMSREERQTVQQRFVCADNLVLCATTAFGMGVDVPDIRRIIHDEMPDGVIDYVQQTGRAGRDGKEAHCILLLEPQHLIRRADLKRKSKDNRRYWMPLRSLCRLHKKRRRLHQLLQIIMASDCIPQGLAKAFRQKTGCCGKCRACRRGRLIPHAPDIGGMKEWQTRAFLLGWQRRALAASLDILPGQVLSDVAMNVGARDFCFPPDVRAPEEMERLLAHFRYEKVHDFDSSWIS